MFSLPVSTNKVASPRVPQKPAPLVHDVFGDRSPSPTPNVYGERRIMDVDDIVVNVSMTGAGKQDYPRTEPTFPSMESTLPSPRTESTKSSGCAQGSPRADVAAKLRECDQHLVQFRAECERRLQQIVADLGSRHRQYLLDMSGLHTNLQHDVQELADLKADLSRFVCPSALSILEGSANSKEAVPDTEAMLKPWLTFGTKSGQSTDLARTSAADAVLTEASLKDHIFMAVAPLYGIKDVLSSALTPVYQEIQKLVARTQDLALKCEQRGLEPLQESQEAQVPQVAPESETPKHTPSEKHVAGDTSFWDPVIDDTITGSAMLTQSATRMQSRGSPGERTTALARGNTHLNFANDLLGGGDESLALLSAMHDLRLPGQDKAGFLFRLLGEEPKRTSPLAHFLTSVFFERILSLVIVANMAFITYQADYAVQNPFDQTTTFMRIAELIFQIFYVLELILKLCVHRFYFFANREWHWNWVDFALVGTTSYDLYMTCSGQNWENSDQGKSRFNLIFLRVLRLARFSKVVRVFRVVRFVNELYVLLKVITYTLRPLFWCMMMLIVFFYIFAVIFVNATTAYLANPDTDKSNKDDILKHWGSVWMAMLSLYQATTGGKDWADISDTLDDTGRVYYMLFLFFTAFIHLALLNILTGVFVDRSMKVRAEDKDSEALAQLRAERSTVMDLCKLHCVMSGNNVEHDASITQEQFETNMMSPAMRARFSVIGLEIWDTKDFFSTLAALGDSEEVDLRTFVSGCMQMRGSAQRLGLQALARQLKELSKILKHSGRAHTRLKTQKLPQLGTKVLNGLNLN